MLLWQNRLPNVVKLLDAWSAEWQHRGRARSLRQALYRNIVGILQASNDEEICRAVNGFLQHRFSGFWTSIAILCNSKMGLHRNIRNMIGRPNRAITLENFTGG